MPHAEETNGHAVSEKPLVNGDKPHSEFISHLTSYPIVSDTISLYTSNHYGAKSLSVANNVYTTAQKNIYAPLSPYLARPYSLIHPYLARADKFGTSSLTKLETKFPIVKEETATVKDNVVGTAKQQFKTPLEWVGWGKDYLLKTYDEEYGKVPGGDGLVRKARAVVGTEVRLAFEALGYVKDVLVPKAKETVQKKTEAATN